MGEQTPKLWHSQAPALAYKQRWCPEIMQYKFLCCNMPTFQVRIGRDIIRVEVLIETVVKP